MGYSIIVFSGVCEVGSENHPKFLGSYDVRGARVFDPRFSRVLERVVTPSSFHMDIDGEL